MSLQQIMSEYTAAQAAAARNPEEYNFTARPGIEMAIRAAKDKLESLEKQYQKEFLAAAVAVFLDGPGAQALVGYHGVIAADASALYRRITDLVDPTLGSSRTFTANQGSRVLTELRNVGVELHVASMKQVDFGPAVEVPTFSDTLAVIRNGVRKALHDDLNRMYLEAVVVRQALALKFTGNSAPVFIVNALPDERDALATPFGKGQTTWSVRADVEVNDDYIRNIIKEVNRRLNPTPVTQTKKK